MNDANEGVFFARFSLVLFVAGLLVSLILAALAPILAVGFCLIAEVLALIFGIVGRRHLSGKVGMIGSIVGGLLLILVLLSLTITSASKSATSVASDTVTVTGALTSHAPGAAATTASPKAAR